MIPACHVDDVPVGEGRAITIAGRRIAVFRTADGWHALDDACPHAGGPLSDGLLADCAVTCPLHERRFDLRTGACSAGEAVAAHVIEIRGDQVFLVLGDRELETDRAA